ncbi:phage tail tape measure protein [Xenorhabdus ishibashii]|uniref:Phage tail tape measure protein n=1 Tax=Xenorhabdus ishibashii TaxID=1034471 RepID=A0A2D0K9M3_9GAMM|nr:phage tail tape measure protein [Xenorhabdus ishibashii]PHM60083.1 phage tail tape measure protein [Xenorhabdus ishibashii]
MANLSTLTVGLLVNATSFKSQIMDAYRHAGRESERFTDKAASDAKKVKKTYSSLANQIQSVSGQLMLLAGTGFSLGTIISHTRKYGQALSDLSAITGATGAQLKKLDEEAQRLGRTTEFGATGIAQALKLMASAKPELLKNTQALTQATEKAVILAQASGIELPEATKALALSLNQFGASAAQAERYINVLAAGAKYGSSEINETAQAIKNGGTMASQAGMSFEELNAAIQVLAKGGIKGAEAGVAIRNVVLALEKSTDKNLKPSVVGLSAALEYLKNKQLSTAQAAKLFGRANLSAASQLVTGRRELDELKKSLTGTQVAYEQASARANNLSSDLDVLSSAFEGLAIKVGQSADGPLRTGVQGATSAINTLAENFNLAAAVALHTLIPVVATKLTAGLRENISAWKATEKATRDAAKQQAVTAQRTIESARAIREQAGEQNRWLTTQKMINKQHSIDISYQKEYTANFRKIKESIATETSAKNLLAEANRKLSYSTRLLSGATAGARGAFSLLGGPFGVAMLAGSAIYYFHQRAQEARESATNLTSAVLETKNALMQLSKVELSSKILNYRDALDKQKEETDKIWLDLQGKKNLVSGVGLGGLWADKKKAQEGVVHAEAEYEKARKKTEFHKKQLEESQAALKALEAGEKPISSKSQSEESNNKSWTGSDDDEGKGSKKKKGSTQILNQYHQLRFDIERAHSTSLGRIILSERETEKKLNEVSKSGLVSQNEIQRLKALNAENHQKQRLELAERYAPVKALIRQEEEANRELKALYSERLLTEQEYLSASRTLYQTSVKDKLAEQAKQIAAPRLDMAGEVDPVVQLHNQLAEQTALYDTYYRNGLISKERHEQLMTAATNRSKDAQFAAAKDLYASQGDFQKMQMGLLDVVEQRTGNALTGMLMGTKSFSESMKELSASLAQSIIQDLVRIAMQAMITKAVSGFFGGFGGASAGISSLASAGSGASSASVGAMGMSTSWQSFTPNAKGGVYNSPSLSSYSGQIVSSPTLFAFAKGAGLMGEAGPEAILPLKRGSDGRLGVEASGGTSNQTTNHVSIVINSDGNHEVKTTSGFESAGQDIANFIDQRFKLLLHKSLGQGGELSTAIKGGRR